MNDKSAFLSYGERRALPGGVYDIMIREKLAMGTDGLGNLNPRTDFVSGRHFNDNTKFVWMHDHSKECEVQLIGEFSPGTEVHPTGNHVANDGKFIPIGDNNNVKFNWTLQCPANAPERLKTVFHNQVTVLFDSIDCEHTKSMQSWILHGNEETPDLILISSKKLFKSTTRNTPMVKKNVEADLQRPTKPSTGTSSTTSSEGSRENFGRPNLTVGVSLPPSVMPGYGGPWFEQTSAAKIEQLDIRDPSMNLIHPSEWWKWITDGSLAYLTATMYIWDIEGHKVYTLNVKTLQILDKSDFVPVRPVIREPVFSTSTPTANIDLPQASILSGSVPVEINSTGILLTNERKRIKRDDDQADQDLGQMFEASVVAENAATAPRHNKRIKT
ncbi:hypothetical protein K435DRAFT_864278 [Dendrothele bispora CBS 962.96]|uniref:Uncharacterized protein n=1 Tax=Dendrothele bispora (strain CBS 962.96) TaxID=1314807 RepID=A0A4S8LND8_DENBC|nr:hypothetical protein K435DRAFT_864278 [Dendrothele bispora CBS 962.96]